MSLHHVLLLNYLAMALLMGATSLAFYVGPTRRRRLHEGRMQRPKAGKRVVVIAKNMGLSVLIMYAACFAASPWLLQDGDVGPWRATMDVVAIFVIYDFLYYLLHRYPFHEWKMLRRVHTVHHTARHTSAEDSLYLHPVELALGILLLVFVGLLWGPVSVGTWGVVVLIYSGLNILVHTGLDLPWPGMAPFNYMARKHAIHHDGMQRGNYASIFPIWDLLFGTAE